MVHRGGVGVFSGDARDYLDGDTLPSANPFKSGVALLADHHRPDHGTSVLSGIHMTPCNYLANNRSVERVLYLDEFDGLRLHSLMKRLG